MVIRTTGDVGLETLGARLSALNASRARSRIPRIREISYYIYSQSRIYISHCMRT